MNTILLTGAGGFLGAQVLKTLLQHGYSIHAIDRKKPLGIDQFGINWHQTNLLDRNATRTLLESIRPEGLIHLAWETKHGVYWHSPANLEWLASSILLLHDFSLCGGKRALVAGSSAEYHWGGTDNLNEATSLVMPDSLYGTSKNALREVIAKWAQKDNLSWSWARFFNIFGPEENPARLLPKVVKTLIDGNPLPFDSGNILRDFMHVSDAGDAVVALYESSVEGPVNIASGQAVSVHDVITIIANHLNASHLVRFDSPDMPNQPSRIVASVDRLHNEVGWQPTIDLTKRIEETCDWWKTAKSNSN